MEDSKPKVPPRSSLQRKSASMNETNGGTTTEIPPLPSFKPLLQPKPKPALSTKPTLPPQSISVKNIPPSSSATTKSTETNHSTITNDQPKAVPKTEAKPIKVVNKLKISANDLNKLRYRTDLFNESKLMDSKGNYLIYDVREDEEQISKMGEIAELLVAGGYFRARIKGLHNFDKIIGGMCWAIQMCNIDLDVDIFYQETLSIGQKIALTEKIVRVLQKMKCPFKLEPHQIQGLDCIHIFPVIQWLVKKSFETRQATSEYLRAYAAWQFSRCYAHRDSAHQSVIFQNPELASQLVHPVAAQLRRRFVHPARERLQGEDVRTKTTLLEYGVLGIGPSQRLITQEGKQMSLSGQSTKEDKNKQQKPLLPESKSRSESDTQMMESLLSSMTETADDGDDLRVSSSLVGSILSVQSEEIKRLATEDRIRGESAPTTPLTVDALYHKKEAKLRQELANRHAELDRLNQSNCDEKLATIRAKLEMIDGKLAETAEAERAESPSLKAEKLQLTELLTALRKQKSELKQFCRDEKQRLEAQLELLNKSQQMDSSKGEMADKLKEIERELAIYEERHDNVRRELADVSKRLVVVQRKFDDVPTRAELGQYQKRFLELYNQLSNKHNETKKFYTLYNILSEERSYLEKEFTLINSILDNFKTAHGSNNMVKDEFLTKFEQTVETIVLNKAKVEQRERQERTKRDQLNTEYIDLVEQQRLYFAAVKEFKEECKHNEQLVAALESDSSNLISSPPST